jgi:hypothetical protein
VKYGIIGVSGMTLSGAQHPTRQGAAKPVYCTHEFLRLCTLASRAHQSFIGADCTLASHRKVLLKQIWRLAQCWVDGIGAFYKMTEPRQVGLDLTGVSGLA